MTHYVFPTDRVVDPVTKLPQQATPPRNRAIPVAPLQTIEFYGEFWLEPQYNGIFYCYAGEGAPTVTGGYAKWQTIDRPQRVGLTVLQGYDPAQLTIPIRFTELHSDGSWLDDYATGLDIELAIARLEWMAGRGTFGTGRAGEPPRVTVRTTDPQGNAVPLIPFDYQPSTPKMPAAFQMPGYVNDPQYVITAIEWDQNPLRNSYGFRVRQDATVTLTEYVQDQNASNTSTAQRAHNIKHTKGITIHSTQTMDTIYKIAVWYVAERHGSLNATLNVAQNIRNANPKLHIRSVMKTRLRVGTAVKVPAGA